MDDEVKHNIKKALQQAEIGVTRSILRRKYKKEGKAPPREQQLEEDAKQIAAQAHQIITERGRNVWDEIKKFYKKDNLKK